MSPVENTLARLIAFPTISSQPTIGIAAYLAERLEKHGFHTQLHAGHELGKCNLIARIGPADTDGLVLSGHMDVVPVEGQPWTSDPFTMTRREDRLIGRGTCDMKGFLAAILEALPRLPLTGLKKELVLIFTHDEEVGCIGSRRLVNDYLATQQTLPKACLIGEPTSFQLYRMHPGHTAARIVCTGKAAHSSKPDLGINAIRLAARVIDTLDALAEEWSKDIRFSDMLERPFVVMNVAQIQGGSAINIVPDTCVLDIGFRPLPGMAAEDLFQQIQNRTEALSGNQGTVQATLSRITPSLCTPEGTCLEDHLRPWATHPRPAAAAFATDGGNFERMGLQTLVFGPGSIDVAHKADEFVPVAELFRAIDVVEAVVQKCCNSQ